MSITETDGIARLGIWQATGLGLAVIASAAWYGLGALLGAMVMVPVIYALSRLRAYAPDARSTAEMIGATLGPTAGAAAGIIQLCAYLLLAAKFASSLGLGLLQLISSGTDPAQVVSWLPAAAVSAAVIAGVAVCLTSTPILTSLVALLVITGLLIYGFLAVAVTTRIAVGSVPLVIGTASTPEPLSPQIVGFGVAMVGVELITVRGARIPAPRRSMSLAVAAVAASAVVLWVGDHRGVAGPWRWTARHLWEVVQKLYAEAGETWMEVGSISLAVAAALASTWAAVHVVGGLANMHGAQPGIRLQLAVVGFIALLAAAVSARVTGDRGIAMVLLGAAPLLLIVLYVFMSEANSRIPGDSVAAWWVRLVMPSLALIAVVKPIADFHFAPVPVATVIAAAVTVFAAAALASIYTRRRRDRPTPAPSGE